MTELVANKFETINIVSAGTKVGADATVAKITSDTATKVNLSGSVKDGTAASFKLNDTSGLTKAVTIDASGISDGALTFGATSGNLANGSKVIGTAGKDTITLGTGFGTFETGAADDTVKATLARVNTGTDYNVIDGGAGVDTLQITDAAALTIVDNNLRKISNIEKIVIVDTTTGNQSFTTGGWFDAAFKTAGVDLTTTSTDGNITIDMTSFTGAATITATSVGTGAGKGAINIQTAEGSDVIKVTAAAAGDAGVVKTFGGNDKITTAGAEAFSITAGAGDDTVTLGSTGVDTLVFGSSASTNGNDTVTGFEFGAGKDALQFSAFIGAAEAESLAATIASSLDASAKNVVTLTDIQDLTASNFGGTASATVIKVGASQKLVVIADKAGDSNDTQNIYFVTTDASKVATVTLVGTINEGTWDTGNLLTA
jgi:hypothetical protein